MGSLIHGSPFTAARSIIASFAQPPRALLQGTNGCDIAESQPVRVIQTGPLPDRCGQCGHVLGDVSPPEGKQCLNCGHLNTRASLSTDY